MDEAWIHEIVRRKILHEQALFTRRTFTEPEAVKQELLAAARACLGDDYDLDTHFTPLATTAGLLEAFSIHPDWRYERAAATAARARELLADRVDVVTEPGHSTLISFRMDDPEETVKRFAENGVIVRDLPGTGLVRVSCGWWTSDEDVDRLIGAL